MHEAAASDHCVRLARLDCCAISDALDKLALTGAVSGLEQRSTSARICGRVVTLRLAPVADVTLPPGRPRHLGAAAIESAQPGDIIAIEQRTGIDAASWGGLLSLGAKVKKVAGVIVDGPVRDIDEARSLTFPVYSRSLTARTARGRVAEAFTNEPIRIGEVTVHPGDFALADASGVAFIRATDIERVLVAAAAIAAREAAMAKAILGGTPISEVMGADYEHMLRS